MAQGWRTAAMKRSWRRCQKPYHYYLVAHYDLPELIKSKGTIVNIGSKNAETG